ncbi:hypothetical protein INT45_009292 [Circinella minor]|uniref:Uncharacterized protein n=1 Tax=Circinella minor TaxID=1195481 RepID=A0A8H7S2M7_9FUNG|nr:hypothetical protein INT45_009292 [Circinella minor]
MAPQQQQQQQEKKYESLTFKQTLQLLDQCQHMVTSQRDTYKNQLDTNRHVSQTHLTQIQHLKNQVQLADKKMAALKQLNARLGNENNSLQAQLSSHSNLVSKDSNNYERLRQLVMKNVLDLPSGQDALLKDEELVKRINIRFQEQNKQVSKLKTATADLYNQLTTEKEAAAAAAAAPMAPSINQNGSYAITHQQLVEMNRIKKEMQEKISEQNHQLNKLQIQNKTLLAQATEVGRVAADNIELRTETDRMKGDIAVYKANIVALKTAKNVAVEEQKELKEEVQRWKEEAEKAKKERDVTRETLQLAVRNISNAGREALKEAESKITQYKDVLDEQERRYNQLASSKSARQSSEDLSIQKKIKDFQNTENQLREANNHYKAVIAELRLKLSEYKRTLSMERDAFQNSPLTTSYNKRSYPNENFPEPYSKKPRN